MKVIMNKKEQARVLNAVKDWFRTVILPNHLKNTEKLRKSSEFDINPFLAPYLAAFHAGELTPKSVANALLYPRVLGTSITTSFGTNMQTFISDLLKESYGSMISGIDIEFIDAIDKRKKYCQVKLGIKTINKGDVKGIDTDFKTASRLAKTNGLKLQHGDLIVGILCGEEGKVSANYKKLRDDHGYPLFVGEDFWYRLTGANDFYGRLIKAIGEVAVEANGKKLLESVANDLAATVEIQRLAGKPL